jgi:hypothetical protein
MCTDNTKFLNYKTYEILVVTVTRIKVVIDYTNYKTIKYWSLQLYV